MNKKILKNIRRDYQAGELLLSNTPEDPMALFNLWQQEAIEQNIDDPTAFVLSTVDAQNIPDSRVVLLKQVQDKKFIFYSNYLSAKAEQININPNISMNFYWSKLSRQIRIRGTIEKTSKNISEQYFKTRPFDSQVAAIISKQSQIVNPEALEELFKKKMVEWRDQALHCPESWGGYIVTPMQFEFWQGRPGRLHHRIQYELKNSQWLKQPISP